MMDRLARFMLLVLLGLTLAACAQSRTQGPQWYKGNFHAHSLWSDGDAFPETVVQWYRDHGYDFFSLSDHNVVCQGVKWMKLADATKRMGQAHFDHYRRQYDGELRGGGADAQVRLRTWEEMRARFERPEFLLIEAEEISDAYQKHPVHLNAVNLATLIKPPHGEGIDAVIANCLAAVEAQARQLGRPMLTTINHPNFGYALTADNLANARAGRFVEVYNGHPGVKHLGDDKHIGVEKMWDLANTARLQRNLPPLLGTASDDAHDYHAMAMNKAYPGRGWVMVRAKELSTPAIIAAMEAGDFYASSGVTLKDIRFDRSTRELVIEIEKDGSAEFTTQFIGSIAGTEDAGVVLATVSGREARYRMAGNELYVRATITSTKPAANPVYEGQKKQAWTQPVGWGG